MASDLGRVYQPALAIRRRSRRSTAALAAMPPIAASAWHGQRRRAHAEYGAWQAPRARWPARSICGKSSPRCASALPRRCDPRQRRGQLHGVAASPVPPPSRFARSSRRTTARWDTACRRRSRRKLVHPERVVVSWNGDGCFQMNGQETRDRGPVRRPRDFHRGRQRHVRNDPHAPGARVSGARLSAPSWSIPISPRWRVPTARSVKR